MNDPYATPAANYLKAIRLLAIATNYSYDFWSLSGPRRASDRVAIMSAIQGFHTPRAKAGINALRNSLIDASGVIGSCERVQDLAFIEWARHHDTRAAA